MSAVEKECTTINLKDLFYGMRDFWKFLSILEILSTWKFENYEKRHNSI